MDKIINHTFQLLTRPFRSLLLDRPPLRLLSSIPLLTPHPNAGNAQITIELLNRIQKRAITARQEDMRRVFGVEGETRRDLDCVLLSLLWHGEGRISSYVQAIFTGKGD